MLDSNILVSKLKDFDREFEEEIQQEVDVQTLAVLMKLQLSFRKRFEGILK